MPPLQRHTALVPLSQEHHNGLMLVLKIKKGIQYEVETHRMATYLLHQFQETLVPHFHEEETGVFLWLPETDPLRVRVMEEHRQMDTLADSISADKGNLSLLRLFIEVLEAHIRFEERVLFPYLQDHFPEQLNDMAFSLQTAPGCHSDAGWPDHFWILPRS